MFEEQMQARLSNISQGFEIPCQMWMHRCCIKGDSFSSAFRQGAIKVTEDQNSTPDEFWVPCFIQCAYLM